MRRRFFPYRGRVSGSCRDPDGARRSCYHAATGPVAASDFTSLSGSLSKGPFITGTDGALYGISREGGTSNRGTIYKLTTAGVRTRLVSFTGTRGAAKGQRPRGPLALGPDGNFYGVTERGGAADAGTLFRMKASGTLTVLAEFTAGGPRLPLGGLITGGDGKFYGTTSVGGVVAAGPNLLYGVAPAGGPGGGGVPSVSLWVAPRVRFPSGAKASPAMLRPHAGRSGCGWSSAADGVCSGLAADSA